MNILQSRMSKKYLYGLMLITLAIAAGIAVIVSGVEHRYQDEIDYYTIASHLVDGRGFSLDGKAPTSYRPPVYPALIAVCLYISGSILFVKLLNVIFIILSAVFYSKIAGRLSDGSQIYVPLLFLVYPVVTYSATTLYPQLLGMMLLAWIILIIFEQGDRLAGALKVGAILGVLILAIPGFLLCAPVICSGFLCSNIKSFRQQMINASLCLLVCTMTVSIWTARNYYQFGTIIPVSSNSGVNLLLGNSENTTPNSGVNADISRYQHAAQGMKETEKDAYYKDKAIEWIDNNPEKAFVLYLKKTANYFNYRLNLATKNQNSGYRDAIIFASYYSILLMAIGWVIIKKNHSNFEKFLYILYISNAFLAAVFFTRIRFRVPFDGIIIVLAAIFMNNTIKFIVKKSHIS